VNIGDPAEQLEALDDILKKLRTRDPAVPLIVEGVKDVRALERLDVPGPILVLNVGKNIIDFCQDVSRNYEEVIILTDWDRKGGHLCRLLVEGLRACDVKADLCVRREIVRLVKRDIKDIQSMDTLIERLRESTGSV